MTRAAGYAAAVAALEAIEARGRALMAEGWVPTERVDFSPLYAARASVRRLQPHTLLWRVTLAAGGVVAVETRDRSDFVSDASDATVIVGAFAEVPHRDPLRPKCREVAAGADREVMVQLPAAREADHRAAVERLCNANGWEGATIARDGERWEP